MLDECFNGDEKSNALKCGIRSVIYTVVDSVNTRHSVFVHGENGFAAASKNSVGYRCENKFY